MIAPVIEDYAEINYGESRQEATRSRLNNSLFHGGNIVLGDGAAEDVIHELKILSALQRFHLDLAVAILALPAALLLVATLYVSASTDGFAIRNFRRLQQHFRVVTLLQLGDDDFDMLLAGSGDQELLGLLITEEAHHGIFFHQFVQTIRELVFIIAALWFNGEGDG